MTSDESNTSLEDPLHDLNPSDLEFQPSEVVVQCSVLQPAVNSFLKNFADIEALYWLPKKIATELVRQEIEHRVTLEALLKNQNWRAVIDPKGDRGQFEKECKRIFSEMRDAEPA